MKKSLSDFATEFQESTPTSSSQNAQATPLPENLEQTIKDLANTPKEELFLNLKKEVAKQKANGTFDIEKLENSLELLSPYLSPAQKANIKEILKQIQ